MSHLYVHDCKTQGIKPGSWPVLTQGLPSGFLAPLTHPVPDSPTEDRNPQWTQVSQPTTLRPPCPQKAEWSWPLGPPATVIYVPVSLSSCELRSHRAAGLGGSSLCFSACLIQTRLTDPMGLGSGSQGARVRGQASRAWKLGVTG